MNYFPFHVGDYAAHTAHLDLMEDLAYRRMLDAYYLREGPLPSDLAELARLIRMKQYLGEVETVAKEFFELTDDGWRHSRCDEEIARMREKQDKARASAQASVKARQANAQRTLYERSADAELPTPTPTPTPKEDSKALAKKPPTRAAQLPDDFLPDETCHLLATKLGATVAVEFPKFADYHRAKGSTMKDWQAAFRTWLNNSVKFGRPAVAPRHQNLSERREATISALTGRVPNQSAGLPFIEGESHRAA